MTKTRTAWDRRLVMAALAQLVLGCGDGVSSDPGSGEPHDAATQLEPDAAPVDGAIDQSDGAVTDAGVSRYPTHNIVPDCAPEGGPVLQIWLGQDEEPDDCHPLYSDVGTVTVWVYTDDIQAPTTIAFSPSQPNGSALVCPIGSPGDPSCYEVDEGEVDFETYEVGDRRGTIRLRPNGPEPIVEAFDATLCGPIEPKPVCDPV